MSVSVCVCLCLLQLPFKGPLGVVTLENGHTSNGYDDLVDVLSRGKAGAWANVCGKEFLVCEFSA